MKSDILNRKDIETLVDTFYDKVQKDNIIGYVFNDVAQTNWDNHLPKMYDFWEVISGEILCLFIENCTAKVP